MVAAQDLAKGGLSLRAVASPVLAPMAGVFLGIPAGAIAAGPFLAPVPAASADSTAALGPFLIGAMFGIPTVSYLLGLVAAWKLRFPRKLPLVVTAAVVAWTAPLSLVAAAYLGIYTQQGSLGWPGAIVGGGSVAALLLSLLFVQPARTVRVVWGLSAALVLGVVGLSIIFTAQTRRDFLGQQPALAFIDQESLDEILPGWEVVEYRDYAPWNRPRPSPRLSVATETGQVVTLEFATSGEPCGRIGPCGSVADLADGSVLWVYQHEWCETVISDDPDDDFLQEWFVERPGGSWQLAARVDTCDELPSQEQVELFFNALQPTTVAAWVDAT